MINVLIYNEFRHEKDPNCRASVIYPDGMHAAIAGFRGAADALLAEGKRPTSVTVKLLADGRRDDALAFLRLVTGGRLSLDEFAE